MKITVKGKDYESWDDVPDAVRKLVGNALPDTDGDGVPDLIEGHGTPPAGSTTVKSTSITVDGRTYDSIDEVPADVGSSLQSAGLLGGPPDPCAPSHVVPSVQPELASGQVLLNGKVVDVDVDAEPRRKHWWNRG